MKITREDRTRPLITLTSFTGGSGGATPGTGLVATGSNGGTEFAPVIRGISADGNAVLGPFVNLAAGSNITLTRDMPGAVASNTIRIHATGGGSGSVATDTIWNAKGDLAVGTGSDTAIRRAVGADGQVLTADSAETDGVKWATPASGGNLIPTVIASGTNAASTTSLAVSIPAAASGNRIILVVGSNARDVNTPTCTNVTFTEVLATSFSTTAYLSIYVGVVAGGSSGTSITITATGSNFIFGHAYEVADALTPTAGSSTTMNSTNAQTFVGSPNLNFAPTKGTFWVAGAFEDNGTGPFVMGCTAPHYSRVPRDALVSAIGYAPGGSFLFTILSGGTSGSDAVAGMVTVT